MNNFRYPADAVNPEAEGWHNLPSQGAREMVTGHAVKIEAPTAAAALAAQSQEVIDITTPKIKVPAAAELMARHPAPSDQLHPQAS